MAKRSLLSRCPSYFKTTQIFAKFGMNVMPLEVSPVSESEITTLELTYFRGDDDTSATQSRVMKCCAEMHATK